MPNEITIPALPCASMDDTLNFYVALGFEITYQQKRPNTYGCVKRDDIDLHFFSMKGVDPANSYSTCLVLIEDADALYQSFAASLREHYGKLPVAGIPRITKPNNKNAAGDYRFNVVDPGGNYIRFIQRAEQVDNTESGGNDAPLTKVGRALKSADLIASARGDFATAAKSLDKLLDDASSEMTPVEYVQVIALRAELAVNLEDKSHAISLLNKLSMVSLTKHEQVILHTEITNVEELAQLLELPNNPISFSDQ